MTNAPEGSTRALAATFSASHRTWSLSQLERVWLWAKVE